MTFQHTVEAKHQGLGMPCDCLLGILLGNSKFCFLTGRSLPFEIDTLLCSLASIKIGQSLALLGKGAAALAPVSCQPVLPSPASHRSLIGSIYHLYRPLHIV